MTVGPLSFEVMEGEFFSLLGPSGCGKTTTLRCIGGFETLSEGSIALDGQRLDDRPPHRRDVGLVFQNYALFPHLTVFDNIAFGLRLRKVDKAEIGRRVGQMLELVDLPDVAARYPAQLSGGQQQRVAIARSLVLEPSLLLFDEPLSNLDFKLRIQMRYELRDLQTRLGKTAVYVTHDQTEALALSDRIAVLSQGRIEQVGTPSEIYERPASAFVADFIGSSNLLTARVGAPGSGADTAVETEHGLTLTIPRVADAAGAAVTLLLRPERFQMAAGSDGDRPPPIASPRACATSRIWERTCTCACWPWRNSPCWCRSRTARGRAPSPRAPRSIWRSIPRTSTCCGGSGAPDGATRTAAVLGAVRRAVRGLSPGLPRPAVRQRGAPERVPPLADQDRGRGVHRRQLREAAGAVLRQPVPAHAPAVARRHAVCVVLGYPLAYFLARSTSRVMTLGLFLLIMPLMVSTVIRVFGWVVILGSEGLVNQALRLLGAGDGVRLLYTEGAVILGLTQQSMPFMVLPIMAAIERISPSLEEAAQNLGASWGQMFARVIVPLSMPGLVSGALLVFSVSMSAFITPALMGGRRVRMVGQQIYEEVLTAYDWPGAASLTIVLWC